jgi:hypothetical protein
MYSGDVIENFTKTTELVSQVHVGKSTVYSMVYPIPALFSGPKFKIHSKIFSKRCDFITHYYIHAGKCEDIAKNN